MADGFKDPLMGKLVMFISGAKFQVRTSTLRLAPTATPLTASHRHPAGRVRSRAARARLRLHEGQRHAAGHPVRLREVARDAGEQEVARRTRRRQRPLRAAGPDRGRAAALAVPLSSRLVHGLSDTPDLTLPCMRFYV